MGFCRPQAHSKGANPWLGATVGLKRKAGKRKSEVRPFTEDELVRLLQADPGEGRKWAWGSAISDMMRLALLTGARQNELATLTVGRIINRDGTEGPLSGFHAQRTNRRSGHVGAVQRE